MSLTAGNGIKYTNLSEELWNSSDFAWILASKDFPKYKSELLFCTLFIGYFICKISRKRAEVYRNVM